VELCFSLTANQPQPAYKPKNSLPNRADDNLRSVGGLASGNESQVSPIVSVKDRTVVDPPVFRDFATDRVLR
jgi:hypothetical protein